MIDILFFARIRERLATEKLTRPFDESITCVKALVQILSSENDPAWGQELTAENIVIAVNQQVVNSDHVLFDGDEVAFFPPVTGG